MAVWSGDVPSPLTAFFFLLLFEWPVPDTCLKKKVALQVTKEETER